MNEIKLFSPATVANLSCGFDVLGLCLDTIGDEIVIRKTNKKGIYITIIEGHYVPTQTSKNVAGVAAQAIYEQLNLDYGFEIELYKNIKPGSGIGSSSASALGAVFGINELTGNKFSNPDLIAFAMKGEAVASGNEHADNLAPGLFGSMTLIRSYAPLDIIEIPTPKNLFISIIHPQVEIKTSESRAVLSDTVLLKKAIQQWGNLGGLIAGMYKQDFELIGRSLEDVIVEPARAKLIPHFEETKESAMKAGALGFGISGSGPSMFALCEGLKKAKRVEKAFSVSYKETGIAYHTYVSKINKKGIKIVSE